MEWKQEKKKYKKYPWKKMVNQGGGERMRDEKRKDKYNERKWIEEEKNKKKNKSNLSIRIRNSAGVE